MAPCIPNLGPYQQQMGAHWSWYAFSSRQGGPQSQYECAGKENISTFLALPRINPVIQPITQSVTRVPDLSWLPLVFCSFYYSLPRNIINAK
jgi:hypothetical protein